MAHDRQVEPRERASALSKGSKTCGDVAANWLRLYAEMPYMRGEHEITEGVILLYLDSLGKLKNPTALHRAFQWCRDHINFLPQPAEIHAQYEIEAGKLIAEQAPKPYELCGDCRGTGWKIIEVPFVNKPEEKARYAVACGCRGKAGAA